MAETFLIVGLGNPGRNYTRTRHNLGYLVVERIAEALGTTFGTGKGDYVLAEGNYISQGVILTKPQTYMNRSGKAVADLVKKFNLELSHLLVIHDDVNLPFGRLRLRGKGSAGGHNGLVSVIQYLGTQEFARLRVGVGSDFQPGEMVAYVLSPFSRAERAVLPDIVERAKDVALSFVEEGLEKAMTRFNRKQDLDSDKGERR